MKDHPYGNRRFNLRVVHWIAGLEFIAILTFMWILAEKNVPKQADANIAEFALERHRMKLEFEICVNASEKYNLIAASKIAEFALELHRMKLELEICVNASKKDDLIVSSPPIPVPDTKLDPCNHYSLRQCAKDLWTYESPLSAHPQSDTVLRRFAKIPDGVIDWHVSEQLKLWKKLKAWKQSYDQHSPFHHNGMIPIEDDYVLYAMIMTFEPMTVLEIGSGHSTTTAHNAMLQLPQNHNRKHICIEPFRTDVIDKNQNQAVPIRIIKSIVQDVDPSEFSALQKNDILFIDSSHVIQAFGDTILELVFILRFHFFLFFLFFPWVLSSTSTTYASLKTTPKSGLQIRAQGRSTQSSTCLQPSYMATKSGGCSGPTGRWPWITPTCLGR